MSQLQNFEILEFKLANNDILSKIPFKPPRCKITQAKKPYQRRLPVHKAASPTGTQSRSVAFSEQVKRFNYLNSEEKNE